MKNFCLEGRELTIRDKSVASAAPPVSEFATALDILRICFALGFAVAIYGCNWLSVAPNRLLPGVGMNAVAVFGPMTHGLVAVILAVAFAPRRLRRRISPETELIVCFYGSCLLLVLLPITAGYAAVGIMSSRPPVTRVALGSGFWLGYGVIFLALLDSSHRLKRRWIILSGISLTAAILVVAATRGWFDQLSLAVEWHLRRAVLYDAFIQHLRLSFSVVLIALCISVPLGWLSFRYARAAALLDALFGLIQVTPAIALFGFLIPLLAALLMALPVLRDVGFAAIGVFPAIVGISAYLALPLMRGIASGLRSADSAVLESARAMGLGEWRTLWDVRLPLGRPVFVGALRVAVVQGISLVTLGGLIGAGGLGAIVFEGMGQFAPDLILLGALPIVALGLVADRLFVVLEGRHD